MPTRARVCEPEPTPSENELTTRFNTIPEFVNLLHSQIWQQRDKLVTCIAGEKVVFAKLVLNQTGDFAQHAIADLVTKAVVDDLKVVEVQHDYLERTIVTTRARDFLVKSHVQRARIWQSRKRICERI